MSLVSLFPRLTTTTTTTTSTSSPLPRVIARWSPLLLTQQPSKRPASRHLSYKRRLGKEPTLTEALTFGIPGLKSERQIEEEKEAPHEKPWPGNPLVSEKGLVVASDEDDDEAYSFTTRKTPQLSPAEKAYLDSFRPKVDPRLSTVFKGYTALDERGMTIPYSKHTWYRTKQIYGHSDPNDDNAPFKLHPLSGIMRLMREPFKPKAYAFDYWKEKRDVDITKRYQTVSQAQLHTLGPELTAAHFVCSFGGKVKFHGFQNWFDKTNWKSLPQAFAEEFVCEAIDLSNTPLFYEGMTFLMRLSDLRSLNLTNCTALDEWAINRLYALRTTLIHLDLSGCHGISDRGLITLWKMDKLKRLVLSGLDDSVNNIGLIALELEDSLPDCYIHGVDFERPPNPKTSGLPADYDPALIDVVAKDVASLDYEKWWGLYGQTFDHDNYQYRWRGRPYHHDFEDLKEDAIEESGWVWRVLTTNPWAPPRELPRRRV